MKSIISEIKKINDDNFDNIYYLVGDDHFLQNFFIKKIKKSIPQNNSIEKLFFIGGFDPSESIIQSLYATDIFQSKKLIILRNPNGLKGKSREELLNYVQKPIKENILILTQDEYSIKNKLINTLSSLLNPISTQTPFFSDFIIWARIFIKSHDLRLVDQNDLNLLVKLNSENLYFLHSAIEKLSVNVENGKKISKNEIIENSFNLNAVSLFNFFDAFGKKDLEKSIFFSFFLLNNNVSILRFVKMFADFFQKMLFIKIFHGTNKSASSFNYTLLNRNIDNKIIEYAKNFTGKDIVQCLRHLQNIDIKIKTSSSNDKSTLTNFIFTSLSNE